MTTEQTPFDNNVLKSQEETSELVLIWDLVFVFAI